MQKNCRLFLSTFIFFRLLLCTLLNFFLSTFYQLLLFLTLPQMEFDGIFSKLFSTNGTIDKSQKIIIVINFRVFSGYFRYFLNFRFRSFTWRWFDLRWRRSFGFFEIFGFFTWAFICTWRIVNYYLKNNSDTLYYLQNNMKGH